MNIAVVGMAPREAAALDMLVRRAQPGWHCRAVDDPRAARWPQADLYVVDTSGCGLMRGDDAALERLSQALAGHPAVLVVPRHEPSWTAAREAGDDRWRAFQMLSKPYGIDDMRTALSRAGAATRSDERVPMPATPVRPVPARPPVAPPPAPPEEAPSLTASEFCGRMGASTAGRTRFMRQFAQALGRGEPFEVRITFQNGLIVHPAERWMAGNTPLSVIVRVARSDALASVVNCQALADEDPMARSARLGLPVQPLEPWLWELAQALDARAAGQGDGR